MDLNALADFNLVATQGGFGRASRAGRRSKATLSRRVAELEEQLGVRLIERHAKGLELTDAGRQLLARTEGPMQEVSEAFAAAMDGGEQVRGVLRIAAPLLFSQLAMGRLCAEFRQRHPEVTLDVVAEDRVVDLVEERFDVAIRPNPRMDSALVGRRFATDWLVIVASRHIPKPAPSAAPVGVPAVITTGREGDEWASADGLTVLPQPVLRLSSMWMARDAVVAGAGVGLLPQSLVRGALARGELVLWGEVPGREVELWVLHTSRRLASPKVKAFVEFLVGFHADGVLSPAG